MDTTKAREIRYPTAEILEYPYPFYHALREQDPVYKLPGHNIYMLSRHKDIVWASKHPELFSSRRKAIGEGDAELEAISAKGYPQVATMTQNDPPIHGKYRAILGVAFTPRRIKELEPQVRDIAGAQIDSFIDEGKVEFAWGFANPIPMTIMASFLGVPADMKREFKRWADDITEAKGLELGLIDRERAVECQRSLVQFQKYFANEIAKRIAAPTDDLISDLITVQIAGERPLTLPEQLDLLRLLVIAGNETTAHMIVNTMWLMLHTHAQPEDILSRPNGIASMLEESLRVESPTQYNQRTAMRDIELHGVVIPAGAQVLLAWASANRDPAAFSAPSSCDFTRGDAKQHVAFGHGPHYCLGAPLARLEGRAAFEQLFARLDNIALDTARNAYAHIPNPTLRSLRELHLTFRPKARQADAGAGPEGNSA